MELPDNYRVTRSSINSFPGYVGFDNKRDDTVKKEYVSLDELFKNIMEASKQKNKENSFVNAVYVDPSEKSTTVVEDDYCVEDQFDALEQMLLTTSNNLLSKVKGSNADVELVNMVASLVNAINVLQEAKERAGII